MAWLQKNQKDKYNALTIEARKHFKEYDWYWSPWRGSVKRYYSLIPSYYFKIVYSKAYITHQKVLDSTLESSIAELEAILKRNKYFNLNLYPYKDIWRLPFYHKKERRKIKIKLKGCTNFGDL